MAKRIGILIFSITIIITGIIAFNRLHYWEQSARIFSVNNEQSFRRGGDRHRDDSDRDERRERFERRDRQNSRDLRGEDSETPIDEEQTSVLSDSLNQTDNTRSDSNAFRDRDFDRGHDHRGDNRSESSIHLENVGWFLAVFAMLTVVTIFIDKIRIMNKFPWV